MKISIKQTLAIGALALSGAFATQTQAAIPPNGSFAGYQIGAISTTYTTGGWKLGTTTTSITVGTNHGIASTVDPYLGSPNNLSTLNGGSVADGDLFTLSNNTFAVTSGAANLTLTVGTYTFLFTSETVTAKSNGTISLFFLGTLTNDTAGRLSPGAASFSMSFTESAPTGGIGASYSLDTPPALVPEPASLALIGLGLAGFSAVRKRKSA